MVKKPSEALLNATSLLVDEIKFTGDKMSPSLGQLKGTNPTLEKLKEWTARKLELSLHLRRKYKRINEQILPTSTPSTCLYVIYFVSFFMHGLYFMANGGSSYEMALQGLPWFLLLIILGFILREIKAEIRRKRNEQYLSYFKDLEDGEILRLFSEHETAPPYKDDEKSSVLDFLIYTLMFAIFLWIFYYLETSELKWLFSPLFILAIASALGAILTNETDADKNRRLALIPSILTSFYSSSCVYMVTNMFSWSVSSSAVVIAVVFCITGPWWYRGYCLKLEARILHSQTLPPDQILNV